MDFVLWVCRVMHVVSIVVWFGGLIFLNVVMLPVLHHEGHSGSKATVAVLRRFLGFIWSSLWTVFITGFLLMLLSPRFIWFDYSTSWQQLLAVKQLVFVLLGLFSWQLGRVVNRMEQSSGDEMEGWRLSYVKLVRRAIFLGILALLSSAGMAVL